MQEAAQLENPFEIESAAVSDRGLNESRPENEDSYLDLPEFGIFAVADGVGGAQAGEVASQMAVEILSEAFANMAETADAEDVMRSAISKANEAIFEMATQLSQLAKMATTIVALHLNGDIATIGHVGDSRLYRVAPDGRIIQETLDHSIVAEEVRAGRMTQEQAASHPSRNIISRALGAEPSVEIDLKTIMVEPGSSFLLCTDGITRHLSDEEMLAAIRGNGQATSACGRLKDLCFERGAEDNLTAVVVHVGTLDYIGDSSHEIPLLEDDAEDTITTPRFGYGQDGASEVSLSPSARFEIVDEGPAPIEFEPEPQQPIETAEVDEGEDTAASSRPAPTKSGNDTFEEFARESHDIGLEPSNRNIKNVIGGAVLLLIGAAVGFGVYYFWSSANPPVAVVAPTIQEMKTTDIPLTTFEESRRLVDQDPQKYIDANRDPQEAQDYFLLGRAYLLTGQLFQAKNAFNTAKSRINELDERDRQTISHEIDLALAVIASGPATEKFTQAVANSSAQNTNESNRPR
jgi:serine/threonine protein phosphatase PrpC